MYIRHLYLFILSFFLFIPVFLTAQISVSKIDASFNPGNKDGIVYALPRTLIQVDVLVKQKELLAGPLRNYAEKYLGITNYISENAFEYSIEEINLSTVCEQGRKDLQGSMENGHCSEWARNDYFLIPSGK